jgi:hypothetical protein
MMCFKCVLRDRAARGDDEARLTLQALEHDELGLVWPMVVGELMDRLGLIEAEFDLSKPDRTKFTGVMVERDNNLFKLTLVQPGQLDAVKARVDMAAELGTGKRVIN